MKPKWVDALTEAAGISGDYHGKPNWRAALGRLAKLGLCEMVQVGDKYEMRLTHAGVLKLGE